MTTARSPLKRLKAQADEIASRLKAMESGTIGDARAKDSITFGIVMDDKVVKIEMPWTTIHASSATEISAWILKYMSEARDSS